MTDDNGAVLREPPVAANEVDTLVGALERQRRYIAWKCGDLDAAGLRATLPPSTLTLGGLLKHHSASMPSLGGWGRLGTRSKPTYEPLVVL